MKVLPRKLSIFSLSLCLAIFVANCFQVLAQSSKQYPTDVEVERLSEELSQQIEGIKKVEKLLNNGYKTAPKQQLSSEQQEITEGLPNSRFLTRSNSSSKNHSAPIFKSTIRVIQNKLPQGLVFRLPSFLPTSVTQGDEVNVSFDINSERAYLAVKNEIKDYCELAGTRTYALDCLRFTVASSSLSSPYYKNGKQYRNSESSFKLVKNLRAYSFEGDGWNIISWIQDGIYFQIYSGSMPKSELIKVARSMASQPPIYKI